MCFRAFGLAIFGNSVLLLIHFTLLVVYDTVDSLYNADVGEEVRVEIFDFESVRFILHLCEIFGFGDVLSLILFFEFVCYLTVFS